MPASFDPLPYSGSSKPIIVLLQSKIWCRSSVGTPIISTITWSGSSAATSVTKSHSPRAAILSMIRFVISRMRCSSRLVILGEKPRFTRRRYFVWRGGSMLSMMVAFEAASSSFQSRRIVPRRAFEKVFGSSDTFQMSR